MHGYISTGSDLPTIRLLNANVKPLVSDIWYDLGLQLLDPEDVSTIKADKPNNASEACTAMFSLWLQKNPSATWNSLMSTLKGPGIKRNDVVRKIEQMLQPGMYVGDSNYAKSCTVVWKLFNLKYFTYIYFQA